MMRLLLSAYLLSVSVSVFASFAEIGDEYGSSPLVNGQGCGDSIVHFVEGLPANPVPIVPFDPEFMPSPVMDSETDIAATHREVTTMFKCHGGIPFVPSATSIHFMELSETQICYYDRTCGNLEEWKSYVRVGASWIRFSSFSEFFSSPEYTDIFTERGRQTTDVNGINISLTASIEWESVERFCEDPSPKICLDRSD